MQAAGGPITWDGPGAPGLQLLANYPSLVLPGGFSPSTSMHTNEVCMQITGSQQAQSCKLGRRASLAGCSVCSVACTAACQAVWRRTNMQLPRLSASESLLYLGTPVIAVAQAVGGAQHLGAFERVLPKVAKATDRPSNC